MSESDPTIEDMRQVIREELRPLWTRLERHDREIYGHNGTPGLTWEQAVDIYRTRYWGESGANRAPLIGITP